MEAQTMSHQPGPRDATVDRRATLLSGYRMYTNAEEVRTSTNAALPGQVAAGCFCSPSVFPSYGHTR